MISTCLLLLVSCGGDDSGDSSNDSSNNTDTQQQAGNSFQDSLKNGSSGPEMVVIPAGTFRMGSMESMEQPVHEVNIKQFAMGKYEVTFAEYDQFAEATSRNKPYDQDWGRGNLPVINVSWYDATAYAEWLSEQTGKQYRLPSESEWEYAARAGTETNYWWGNEIGQNQANCSSCGSQWDSKQTAPVGSFQANPYGLYDTLGNVSEWIADSWHDNYIGAPNDGRVWVEGANNDIRVRRGGAWQFEHYYATTTGRTFWSQPNNIDTTGGFRVAITLAPNDATNTSNDTTDVAAPEPLTGAAFNRAQTERLRGSWEFVSDASGTINYFTFDTTLVDNGTGTFYIFDSGYNTTPGSGSDFLPPNSIAGAYVPSLNKFTVNFQMLGIIVDFTFDFVNDNKVKGTYVGNTSTQTFSFHGNR